MYKSHYLLIVLFVVSFNPIAQADLVADQSYKWLEQRPDASWVYPDAIKEFYRSNNRKANELFFNQSNPHYSRILESPVEISIASRTVKTLRMGDQYVELLEYGKNPGIAIRNEEHRLIHYIYLEDLEPTVGLESVLISDIRLTADHKYLEVQLGERGAISLYEYRLINLATFEIELKLSNLRILPRWDDEIKSLQYKIFDGRDFVTREHVLGTSVESDTQVAQDEISFEIYSMRLSGIILTESSDQSVTFIRANNATKPNGIVEKTTFVLDGDENREEKSIIVPEKPKGLIVDVASDEENRRFTLIYQWGAKYWLEIFSFEGVKLHDFMLPAGVIPSSGYYSKGRYYVNLRSLQGYQQIIYFSFSDGQWYDENDQYLNFALVENYLKQAIVGQDWYPITIDILESPTHDSEQTETISSLMVYMKGRVKLGRAPILMRFYGGFGNNFIGEARLQSFESQFLYDGGIIVLPAIRGGGEKGPAWFEDGSQLNKVNSAMDVISVAKDLVTKGYTQASKIAITGTSNGGMVTGSALALSPESFGLAITINGVMDLMSAQWLDAPYFGWSYEYHSALSVKGSKAIMKYSPLTNVKPAKYPPTLVMVGLQDDRVNPAHSFKFVAKLQENQLGDAPILLSSIKNSGHHPMTSHHPGVARAFQARMWTMIYQVLFSE